MARGFQVDTVVERVLALRGELDLEGAPVLERVAGEALARRPDRLVLDCRDVTFCDSSGLNVLLRLHGRAGQAGAQLVLADISSSLRHVLRLTETERVLALAGTVDEALARPVP
ncbi:STAS domain-containing protein [Streptomyces sp. ME19-01-6]|uniref:STAS domain-containing protein n=1 Tax=Streptomyces sp. ME19-01-6 TaxID=3028686 RepID=UPI0029B04C82|nr:STAS domain-containing protein [Streptomyces sp. ME19-01-6]MDX3231975.1 STAS domain-containing protein [Streptomyces sp. ME19-01-6]